MIAQGALVEEFEYSVGSYLRLGFGVATSSGTAALVLALQILGIGRGAEVILPTYVCRSVLEAVMTVGATPKICDVGHNWVMTSDEVERFVSDRTAAIIAVHIFGIPVDVESLKDFEVPVIEDACQALGMKVNGVPAGGLGDLGILSFHATKCLTTAEGGMVVSNNNQLIADARRRRDGTNGIAERTPTPLSDLQAALGLSQLSRYDQFLERRRKLRSLYTQAFQSSDVVELLDSDTDFLFRFPLRVKTPFKVLQAKMRERNVAIRQGVDQLLHRDMGMADGSYPNAVKAFEHTASIPFYPALCEQECKDVAEALIEVCM